MHRPSLSPRDIAGTHLYYSLSRTHGHSAAEKITSMKNFQCSAVPQPLAPSRTSHVRVDAGSHVLPLPDLLSLEETGTPGQLILNFLHVSYAFFLIHILVCFHGKSLPNNNVYVRLSFSRLAPTRLDSITSFFLLS